jgi:hypothetical protein
MQLYSTSISNPASGRCLAINNGRPDIGAAITAQPCNKQQFYYDFSTGEIVDINNVVCLGVC